METIESDLQRMVDYSMGFVDRMLLDGGEYYPFGVNISNSGEVIPIGYNSDRADNHESQKIILELQESFNSKLLKNEIRAYVVVYDVRIDIDDKGGKSDAVIVVASHESDKSLPKFCFPYTLKKYEVIFGESFVIETE